MSSLIEAREKGAQKAKKMDFAKTKTDIYKQPENFLSKIRCVTVFTSVIQFKKKKSNFDFGQKSSNLGPFLTSKGHKRA